MIFLDGLLKRRRAYDLIFHFLTLTWLLLNAKQTMTFRAAPAKGGYSIWSWLQWG